MHIGEDAEIVDAADADVVDQAFHPAEIFHPQRHRRVREQARGVHLAVEEAAAGAFPLGHVLDRDHEAVPALFVAGQHGAVELDIETFAGQRIIDRMAGEARLPIPELGQFLDQAFEGVVAQHVAEIGHQMRKIAGAEQRERLAVHFKDVDALGALPHPLGFSGEKGLDVPYAVRTPLFEQRFDAAIVLDPERDRRELEHR